MPPDEASPGQPVRATSSRRETTDGNKYSGSLERGAFPWHPEMGAAAAWRFPGGRSSLRPNLTSTELRRLREFGQSLTDNQRIRGCGCKVPRGNVGAADEIVDITAHCDHAWLCPICAYRVGRRQFQDLTETLTAWTSRGGSVAMLTLTQRHIAEDELGAQWDRLEKGWAALARGSGWRADRKKFGLRGYLRVTEVVHDPANGWNVHFHVPLLLDTELERKQLSELEDRLTARFMRGIKNAGGQASFEAQRLDSIQPGSERQLAGYLAKGTTASCSATSRTPMAVLADLMDTGEGLWAWNEFSFAVTKSKRRRYSPSHGLDSLMPHPTVKPQE